MLNQRWMFKHTKTSGNPKYQERVGRLISKSAFVFKLNRVAYWEYCIEFMFRLFIEKYFESKGGRKRKSKCKIMIYINCRRVDASSDEVRLSEASQQRGKTSTPQKMSWLVGWLVS